MNDINWCWNNDGAAYRRIAEHPESLLLVQTDKAYRIVNAGSVRPDLVLPHKGEKILRYAIVTKTQPVQFQP